MHLIFRIHADTPEDARRAFVAHLEREAAELAARVERRGEKRDARSLNAKAEALREQARFWKTVEIAPGPAPASAAPAAVPAEAEAAE